MATPARYECLELVATRDSTGEVYRAHDRKTGATISLKLGLGRESREALAREASYAALAISPRLPELVDAGVTGHGDAATAYLALRWVEGAALAPGLLTMSTERALVIVRDVAEALGDLHAIGVAHGDVKPSNVVINAAGRASLIDFGLAGPLQERELRGATPRYLATGDADLGDGRARDMVALGALLAELVDVQVARAPSPVAAAREARFAGAVENICAALLTRVPGARPSATWVCATAGAALSEPEDAVATAERRSRSVRGAYLRVRAQEIAGATRASSAAAPWLREAVATERRRRALVGEPAPGSPESLGRMGPDGLARWLCALVGATALSWPVHTLLSAPEPLVADALTRLARRLPPAAWSIRDVELAVRGGEIDPTIERSLSRDRVSLALAVARTPADPMALAAVEQAHDVEPALVLAAAEALRLGGELGRARSLASRLTDHDAEIADILRRAGDLDDARERAQSAIDRGADPEARARATLARMALDAGRLDDARALVEESADALTSEVAALVAAASGDRERAEAAVVRGEALARSPEERARLAGARGYLAHGVAPAVAHRAFAKAADYAVQAGALVEEATYRTGEAAAAVELGLIGEALSSARRAAMLWEHLGKPKQRAHALLASAAAYATAGSSLDAARVAHLAIACAKDAHDARAEAYAHWAIADTSPTGSVVGAESADVAAALLAGGNPEDRLRAAARCLRHRLLPPRGGDLGSYDALASRAPPLSAGARLEWWTARALDPSALDGPSILAEIVRLRGAPAELSARGPALAAGVDLAERLGDAEAARHLRTSLAEAARRLSESAPPELADSVSTLAWVARARLAPADGMRPEQARDLETVVRMLGDRESLRSLLRGVVDALILWTGVERGLLLLPAPGGRLVPRAARNLARADLGPEQLELSRTLARRAFETQEPLIAVDAAGDLPSLHESVHALKLRSVLALPLIAGGDVLGVVYLDDRVRRGAFGPSEIGFTRTIAQLAAVALRDARAQALLRRSVRQAERASLRLTAALAEREAQLDAAERQLAIDAPRGTRFPYDDIVGESEPIRAMLRVVDRLTATDVPILLIGESGSGKELVARAIHRNGPRAARAFVSENCSAIPEPLLESALFGHARGAFTGADRPRAGLFEAADLGTLFLDEIGEMSLSMQAKLLRVLEDHIVKPLGADRGRKVDVRVIGATHRDLKAMVSAGTFREDLFYRLNIVTLSIPPLRERPSDIPLLVERMLRKHSPGRRISVTLAAMASLSAYAWPGNVRQLENEIRRAVVLCDGVIDRQDLTADIANTSEPTSLTVVADLDLRGRTDRLTSDLVRQALTRTQGNQSQAAKLLGISRFGLQKMMKRLSI